ncbi:MAG: peptidoglycan-binding protein, partial [Parcubacteria group bacterium]|nr:peptidoglycan-binding protein [Parcubacteria group bacterium]
EYGYIYETRFQTEVMLKEAAFRTYQGLLLYFGDSKKLVGESAWFLPYEWEKPLSYGVLRNNDVAAFQSALSLLGFYPPRGTSLRDCPVSGNFKECTKNALFAFQTQYGIAERGEFGAETREKLNELFK